MDRFTIEPSMGIFNLFNFANFNLLPEVMTGLLNGSTQSLNGTTSAIKGRFASATARASTRSVRHGNSNSAYA